MHYFWFVVGHSLVEAFVEREQMAGGTSVRIFHRGH